MSSVFVVDTNKQPLDPVHPARARKLLSRGKAAVYRIYPFTIILNVAISDPVVADLRIKIDPGSKYNQTGCELPKTHWVDAACVGKSTPETLQMRGVRPLLITANGHGCRQMCRMDKYGFPRTGSKEAKFVKGFQTGDIVKAVVTSGKKAGTYVGRVAVRTTGSFNLTTVKETVQGMSFKYCQVIHRMDGYSYQKGEELQCPSPAKRTRHSSSCLKGRGLLARRDE